MVAVMAMMVLNVYSHHASLKIAMTNDSAHMPHKHLCCGIVCVHACSIYIYIYLYIIYI